MKTPIEAAGRALELCFFLTLHGCALWEKRIVKVYEVTGLSPSTPPDQYGFYVRGRNSRGFGEDSDAVFLDVT